MLNAQISTLIVGPFKINSKSLYSIGFSCQLSKPNYYIPLAACRNTNLIKNNLLRLDYHPRVFTLDCLKVVVHLLEDTGL